MKIIRAVIVFTLILTFFIPTAQAEDRTITVDDAMAVAKQIKEYRMDILVLASVVYNEARGVDSRMEQAAVAWCVLNRVDEGWGDIIEVATEPHQFAYKRMTIPNQECKDITYDVVFRWLMEKRGIEDVGRVLPKDYLFFAGRSGHNWFRKNYGSRAYWDWSLENPYEGTIATLTELCDIPIIYITTDEMRAERDKYGFDFLPAGLCFTDKILIHNLYKDNEFVLAHEIAHHLDWSLTEEETTRLAKELIKEIVENG